MDRRIEPTGRGNFTATVPEMPTNGESSAGRKFGKTLLLRNYFWGRVDEERRCCMSASPNFAYLYETCINCGVSFGSPILSQRKVDGKSFYCPNGHSQYYTETEVMRLKREIEAKQRSLEWERSQRETAERGKRDAEASLTAQKAQATRARNELKRVRVRVHHGVCPCCNRSFQNLRRHMETKHPGELAKQAEEISA
jgi:hypothetical protein